MRVTGLSTHDSEGINILVVRADRLGDVVLSTPVIEAIKRHYPRSRLTMLVQPAIAPIMRGIPGLDEVMLYEPADRHRGARGLMRLVSELRARKFRIAVVLQSQPKLAAAVFLAGIEYRIGPLSKLHSFLFYNRGVRQHRSLVEMHEADYNLQLLRRMGIRAGAREIPVTIAVSEPTLAQARGWLVEQGWNGEEPIVAVHPGMGGSALNWPESHYQDLVRELVGEGTMVLLTGGPAEADLLKRIAQGMASAASLGPRVLMYPGERNLQFLAALYGHCKVVVAPSTGPLHVAVAMRRPVVTFYPPIRVQSALRWGPYVSEEATASVMVPEVYCGEGFRCRMQLCNSFPCMKSLTVGQALEYVHQHLKAARP